MRSTGLIFLGSRLDLGSGAAFGGSGSRFGPPGHQNRRFSLRGAGTHPHPLLSAREQGPGARPYGPSPNTSRKGSRSFHLIRLLRFVSIVLVIDLCTTLPITNPPPGRGWCGDLGEGANFRACILNMYLGFVTNAVHTTHGDRVSSKLCGRNLDVRLEIGRAHV